MITLSIALVSSPAQPKPCWDRTNCSRVNAHLEELLLALDMWPALKDATPSNIDTMVEDLHDGIQETIRSQVPHKIPYPKHKHLWTIHLSILWRTLKLEDRPQSRWCRRHPQNELQVAIRQSYLSARAQFGRAMKVAKQAAWATFLEEVNDGGPTQMWTTLKKMKTISSPLVPLSFTNPDAIVASDASSVAKMVLHKFCPDLDGMGNQFEETKTSNEALLMQHVPAHSMEYITPEELRTCIRSRPRHAAPWHDGLATLFVLNCLALVETCLFATFNASLEIA